MHNGLHNAPATLQGMMEYCLGFMNLNSILIYLDDVVVLSVTFQEQIIHLDAVLFSLHQYGLNLKPREAQNCP